MMFVACPGANEAGPAQSMAICNMEDTNLFALYRIGLARLRKIALRERSPNTSEPADRKSDDLQRRPLQERNYLIFIP